MMCYRDELWFVSGKHVCINIRGVNITNHIKRMKNKNQMIVSTDAEK